MSQIQKMSKILKMANLGTKCSFQVSTSCNTSVSRRYRKKKNLDQLYSSINHHRTTANLIKHCVVHVWWCLVVSDACLVVSMYIG